MINLLGKIMGSNDHDNDADEDESWAWDGDESKTKKTEPTRQDTLHVSVSPKAM